MANTIGPLARRLLAAPVFKDDDDKTRVARLLNTMLLTFLGIILAYGIISIAAGINLSLSLPIVGGMILFGLLMLFLLRRGLVQLVGLLFVGLLWAFMVVVTILFSGVQGSSLFGLVVVTVIAGLFLGGRGGFIFAGLSIATAAGLMLAESNDLLPPPQGLDTLGSTWASLTVYVIVAAVVLHVATRNLRQALERARGNEHSLAESNQELQSIRASLEQQRDHLQTAVRRYVKYMADVGQGHLADRLHLDQDEDATDDPLVVLGHSLNDTVAKLQQVIRQIRDTAGSLSASSSEILTATTQQVSGAGEQSAAISQTSITIDEVRTIAEQTAQRAQGVAASAQRTAEVSRAGQDAVASAVAGMGQIKQKVETITHNILALSEQTQAIGQIITTVSEIAAQSNMLALNAAVEAARAGEAGKGFAVVASEVRSLAEQSRTATTQVKEILTDIQRGVNAAVMAAEEGMKGTDVGVKLASEAGGAIQKLAESVTESTQSSVQIATAAGQQLSGMEQITLAMKTIQQVTAQSLSSVQQSERAAEELNKLSGQLRDVVEQYWL